MTRRFDRRLGAMRLTSTRHPYPLVAVYAERFVAPRFACIGDAAWACTRDGMVSTLAWPVRRPWRRRCAKRAQKGAMWAMSACWPRWNANTAPPRGRCIWPPTRSRGSHRRIAPGTFAARCRRAVPGGVSPVQRALAAAVSGSADRPPLVSRLVLPGGVFESHAHGCRSDNANHGCTHRAAWLAHYGAVPPHSITRNLRFIRYWPRTLRSIPNAIAWGYFGATATYAGTDGRHRPLRVCLRAVGVKKGVALLVMLPTFPQAVVAFYAANRLGARPAMIHPLSTTAEITHYLDQTGARVCRDARRVFMA